MSENEERARSFRDHAFAVYGGLDDEGLKVLYGSLFERLKSLHGQAVPDLAAIDSTMREIDDVHAALKARHAQPGDPAQF